jgi:uroporphyrinogen decarboxylase
MNSRELVRAIFAHRNSGANALWLGMPHLETEAIYLAETGLGDMEQLSQYVGSDCRWYPACSSYQHPSGTPMFGTASGAPHVLADHTDDDIAELDEFPWPDPKYNNYEAILAKLAAQPDKALFSGFWCHYFHVLCDLFGMEVYFVKMYTDPALVEAVTERVLAYFEVSMGEFLSRAGDLFDVVFFGNDFGTQSDLLVSPESFDRFILPGVKRITAIAKKYGKPVMLHSCGSIYRVIPKLIDAGIDALHPLQAKARNMDAATLAREFKNDLVFCGGVDTQELLVTGSPAQVAEEVHRLRSVFGENYIVSPSHESLLPNVPFQNVLAMCRAAKD